MASTTVYANDISDRTWLSQWAPEDAGFWESTGKTRPGARSPITTANLTLAFIVWFVVSALVVRLPGIGFNLTSSQLFWLAALPGLPAARSGSSTPSSCRSTARATWSPCRRSCCSSRLLGWFFAVQDPTTPLLGAGGACVSRRARRRQLLVVHAVDEPLLPQAPAGHRARDPGRRRQFRGEHRPVRHALDHRLRARRLAARWRRRASPATAAISTDLAAERDRDLCAASSSCSAFSPGSC